MIVVSYMYSVVVVVATYIIIKYPTTIIKNTIIMINRKKKLIATTVAGEYCCTPNETLQGTQLMCASETCNFRPHGYHTYTQMYRDTQTHTHAHTHTHTHTCRSVSAAI